MTSPRPIPRSPGKSEELEFRSRISSLTNHRPITSSPVIPESLDPSIDENIKVRGSTDSDELSDPEPDYQESLPPAVYSELANTMIAESRQQLQLGNCQKAEAAHWKAMRYLEDREAKLGIPFQKRDQMLEDLADIYMKRKKYEAAKNVLANLLKQESADSNRKWRCYHALAIIYMTHDRLNEAEKFAKRAYIGREKTLGKGHAAISQSADLLISIYEKQGDMEAAQAWRNLHPDENMLRDNPQVFKHVGTTRVAWNPDLSMDMNAPTQGGKTILINAIVSGDEDMVQQALQRGADIEKHCNEGINPLMYAVIHSQERIAGVLLSRGANPEATTLDWPPLHKACDQEDIPLIETLLSYSANTESRAPKRFKLAKLLAQQQQPTHESPPLLDSSDLDSDEESSPSPNHAYTGWTPLLRAALRGQSHTISLLLDNSANIEARNPSGNTPLSCAAESHHFSTVQLLLSRGANAHTHDKFRWTALHRTQVRRSPSALPIASSLLESGHADVNAKCEKGMSALHHAIERDNVDMVPLLLEYGADIAGTDVVGRTPLHTAIECRRENMVHLLLQNGADTGIRDAQGMDALTAAKECQRRSPEIVKLLEKERKRRKGSVGGESAMSPGGRSGSGSFAHRRSIGGGGGKVGDGTGGRGRMGSLTSPGWMGRPGTPTTPASRRSPSPAGTLGLQSTSPPIEGDGKGHKKHRSRGLSLRGVVSPGNSGGVAGRHAAGGGGGNGEKKGSLKSAVSAGSAGEKYRMNLGGKEKGDSGSESRGSDGGGVGEDGDGEGPKEGGHWWNRRRKAR